MANRVSFLASLAFAAFVVHVRASLAVVSIDVLVLVVAHFSDECPYQSFLGPKHDKKESERKYRHQINELTCQFLVVAFLFKYFLY